MSTLTACPTLNKWLANKSLWSFLIIALTAVAMGYEHSFRACAGMAVFALIMLAAVYEDYNDPDAL